MNRQNSGCAQGLLILLLAGPFVGQAGAVMIRSDFDHDCDVDAVDFAHFTSCALGPAIPQLKPLCADTRLDADADVDMDGFGIFQRCYSGAGLPADPNCLPCPARTAFCGGACIDVLWDGNNCGACGYRCALLEHCLLGQ